LVGKVAIVTGTGFAGNIGEAIALALAEAGASVVCADLPGTPNGEIVAKRLEQGLDVAACDVDISDEASVQKLIQFTLEKYKRLDILVNNAGTNPFFGDVLSCDEKAWDKTCDVNLKGSFFMSQHAAKLMKKSGGGAIVNVASVNGVRPAPTQGVYSITKAGIIAMTKSFAKELAPDHIRVNALLPGLTETKFTAVLREPQMLKMILPMIPMGRMAKPEEMAGAVLYLVSDAASYTTGICLTVDGGMLA